MKMDTYTLIVCPLNRIYPGYEKYSVRCTFTITQLWESKYYTQVQLFNKKCARFFWHQ